MISLFNNLRLPSNIRWRSSGTSGQPPKTTPTGSPSSAPQGLGRVVAMRDALTHLHQMFEASQTSPAGPAQARSTVDLHLDLGAASRAFVRGSSDAGLSTGQTETVLRSEGPINATSPSFSPTSPSWSASTAAASISGTYDGSEGTGALTFEALDGGVHGTDRLRFNVLDPGGKKIETITVNAADPLGQSYALSTGLSFTLGAGSVLKGDAFTLDVVAGASTSFSPASPSWLGSSAQVSLGGSYDGSNGTDALRVEVFQGGVHGADTLRLRVYDSGSSLLETVTIGAADPIGQQYTLQNGIALTLGAGALLGGTSFQLDVQAANLGITDPDQPLSASPGLNVVDGAFTINGTLIRVSSSDSLNAVLSRISSSSAGVTASYDAGANEVVLTQKSLGASPKITIGADTSGFVAAAKLGGAATLGVDKDSKKIISSVAALSSIQSGFIYVNNKAISVDVNVDSLSAVISRINAAGAKVTARLNADEQRLLFQGHVDGAALSLDEGSTNLLTALGVSTGSFAATTNTSALSTTLGEVAAFGGIQSGSFEINGKSLAVDVQTDTLQDLISRIEAEGLTVKVDPKGRRLSIERADGGAVTLKDGSSGLFLGLGVLQRTYTPIHRGVSKQRAQELSVAYNQLAGQLSATLPSQAGARLDGMIRAIGRGLGVALSHAQARGPPGGVELDLQAGFVRSSEQQQRMQEMLMTDFQNVRSFLFGDGGLLQDAGRLVDGALRSSGQKGLLLNTLV